MSRFNLEEYRIANLDVYYIPDFIEESEECHLLTKIADSPHHRWKQLTNRRLQLLGGELARDNILLPQAMPHWITSFPDVISRLRETGAFRSSPHEAPNHIILNEYLPGQGIMPHEDGPSYHPVVATISLNSHTIFHYYRYIDGTSENLSEPSGRSIDPTPVLTLLLEPRSVVITQGSLYKSHLHGISGVTTDHIQLSNPGELPKVSISGISTPLANWSLLKDQDIIQAIKTGRELGRGVRYSLTCRDVERIAQPLSKFVR